MMIKKGKYYIKTYGCAMNEAESARLEGFLAKSQWLKAKSLAEANLIVINSCSVRQGSEDKVYGLGQKIIPLKKHLPTNTQQPTTSKLPHVILTGCMVGGAKGERRRTSLATLKRKMPWVDEFLTFNELLNVIARSAATKQSHDINAERDCHGPICIGPRNDSSRSYMIPISQGCDNFCSYCVVPYTRGKEVSRAEEEIVCEIKAAVGQGAEHIMLLGQNVNSWGRNSPNTQHLTLNNTEELPFSKLLKKVHAISGVEKISFLTLNPYDINDELIDTLALPKIDRWIHLPIQSGDNAVLKRMNRRYTGNEYKKIVQKMRQRIPGVQIGTDIIVGFPGETEKQFKNSLKLVREMKFANLYAGIFSSRDGTAAAGMGDNIPLTKKKRRHKELMKVWKDSKK